MIDEPLTITSGLPFAKEINISLPVDRTWWLELIDFEILMQIREEKSRSSTLVMDMADFLTITKLDANNFRTNIRMNGSDTRTLLRGGFYDIIMSDPGTTDGRAYVILKGPVKRLTVITAETEDAP